MDASGVEVDSELHSDLSGIMKERTDDVRKTFPEGSFQSLFWDQQLQASQAKDHRQVRWHPMIIKWCLHLKMISFGAYHALRTSGFITLPSERTLRDYTNLVKSSTGIQPEVNRQLAQEARVASMLEWQKYVVVVFDEVKIKEDLVYDKHTSQIIGFVNLGNANDQLNSLTCTGNATHSSVGADSSIVADHMLVFMVRGLLTDLEFPYAQFATRASSATELFPIVWEVVRNLESCSLKVLAITCDGASQNRKFFKMHQSSKNSKNAPKNSKNSKNSESDPQNSKTVPVYKTVNPYSQDKRPLFFISDITQLLVTLFCPWKPPTPMGK